MNGNVDRQKTTLNSSRRRRTQAGWKRPCPAGVRIFISYSHKDERLRQDLASFLRPLEREGLVVSWFDGQIHAGRNIDAEILAELNSAHIMVCLVSTPFLASDYIYDTELTKALARHRAGKLHVIPVILRPSEWERTPLRSLRALPKNGKPITKWQDRHEAFLDVVRGIRQTVELIENQRRLRCPS